MNVAILLAAGNGTRIGNETPKQFIVVAGKMLIEYAIEQFQTHEMIDEIAVVVSEEYQSSIQKLISNGQYSKLKKVVIGGSKRYLSSLAALKSYSSNHDSCLLIHDAARPLVSHQIITDVINAMQHANAAVVAIPATDTILQADSNQCVTNIPQRNNLYYAQTPQAFRVHTLEKAFELGLQDSNFNPTDDSSVVFNYLLDEKIIIVKGESINRKITFKDDIHWLQTLAQQNMNNDES